MVAATTAAALVLLHGVVTIGPTQPVCRSGVPCSKPAGKALMEFTGPGGFHFATTDAHGRYSIRLVPGVWTVDVTAGVATTPRRITVRPVASLRRDFRVDTGIR
jgi:hypothetical protein